MINSRAKADERRSLIGWSGSSASTIHYFIQSEASFHSFRKIGDQSNFFTLVSATGRAISAWDSQEWWGDQWFLAAIPDGPLSMAGTPGRKMAPCHVLTELGKILTNRLKKKKISAKKMSVAGWHIPEMKGTFWLSLHSLRNLCLVYLKWSFEGLNLCMPKQCSSFRDHGKGPVQEDGKAQIDIFKITDSTLLTHPPSKMYLLIKEKKSY